MNFPRSIVSSAWSRFTHGATTEIKEWSGGRKSATAVLILCFMTLPACISVNAPDKPIVIELNINIKQEVIYRLAEDVKQNIDSHPDIF